MDNTIERYVYDVARRLPEKEREDVKDELRANIYDMLPEGVTEEQIRKVLYELGSPASLAGKYRQNPRYLISPAYYEEYVSVLKWVLPLVGVIVMIIGFATSAFDAVKAGSTNYAFVFSGIISKGISMGVSAAFQALVWTTVGFVIAERSGQRAEQQGKHSWRIEDLPDVHKTEQTRLSLSESVAELVVLSVFTVIGLLFCSGRLPFAMVFSDGGLHFTTIFNESFLALCVPVILATFVLGVIVGIVKIKDRRWSPLVCVAVVAKSLAGMAMSLYLLNQPNMFTTEFHQFWSDLGVLQAMPLVNGRNALLVLLMVLIVIGTVTECIKTVTLTVKNSGK
ncbi:hypothetical protein SDC9_102867 [bioreactor metagenome]|uniref:Uncharacterized protein n=1 Tax=bioreactor metagenome TaxID=1076179 RepID=A0A645ATI0_9ZZZZ